MSIGQLKRLLALARDLMQAPDQRSVLELVGPALQELLVADGALVMISLGVQPYATEFDRRGFLQPVRQESVLFRSAERALADRTPMLLPEATADPAPRASGRAAGAISLLAFPFPPIEPVGVLAAFWDRKGQKHQLARHISTLRHIGELTGAALGSVGFRLVLEAQVRDRTEEVEELSREHARELQRRNVVEEEIRRISVTDVLTGMLNRRGFFLQAEQGFKVAQRQGLPSTLIFADIDGLKGVNDRLGHDTGDRLIQDAARILGDSFRGSDVVARLGGDEFAALTLDSAQPEAILARIQENIERFQQSSHLPYQVSFSTGIVRCDPASDLNLFDYLSLADKQMYDQKKKRR